MATELKRLLAGEGYEEPPPRAAGLTMFDGFRGELAVGRRRADVLREDAARLQVRLAVDDLPADEAMRINHWLPVNMRYAGGRRRRLLLADVQLAAGEELATELADIRAGLRSAMRAKTFDRAAGAKERSAGESDADSVPEEMGRDRLDRALAGLPWGNDGVVQRDVPEGRGKWEIRVRLRGGMVPVLVDGGPAVRVYHDLLERAPPSALLPLADQSLRINGRLRLCRLALVGECVAAETLLPARRVTADALEAAALAVASATREAEDGLAVMAGDTRVADAYREMFL
jgi:hypothetical protein